MACSSINPWETVPDNLLAQGIQNPIFIVSMQERHWGALNTQNLFMGFLGVINASIQLHLRLCLRAISAGKREVGFMVSGGVCSSVLAPSAFYSFPGNSYLF